MLKARMNQSFDESKLPSRFARGRRPFPDDTSDYETEGRHRRHSVGGTHRRDHDEGMQGPWYHHRASTRRPVYLEELVRDLLWLTHMEF